MYNQRQASALMEIVVHSPDGDFRALAISALGAMGITEAIPIMQTALDDQFARFSLSGISGNPGMVRIVSQAAEVALRVVQDPKLDDWRRQRLALFDQRLAEARRQATIASPPTHLWEIEVPLQQLVTLSESMYREDRMDAVLSLAMGEGPQTEQLLIVMLGDEDWQVRWRAAEGLGLVGTMSSVPTLIEQLHLEHAREKERIAQGKRIQLFGYNEYTIFLQDQFRLAIQRLLERNPGPAADNAYASLVRILQDQSEAMRIRIEMALLLAHFGERQAIPMLITGLSEDRDGSIRAQCATALGELGATEAIPVLTAALDDPYRTRFRENLAVKEAAEEALGKLNEVVTPNK